MSSNSESKSIYNEIIIVEQLSIHPNVIFLENVIKSDTCNDIYLVYEYIDFNLKNLIYSNILQPLQIKYIAYQILITLNYIHSADILHTDIKPSNILLNESCEIKITDFGLAKVISNSSWESNELLSDFKTIRWYKSPEMILGSIIIDISSDIWSFGCILAEMIIGKPLFPGNSTINQLDLILQITGKPSNEDMKELESYMMATCLLDTINCKVKKNLREILSDKPNFDDNLLNLLSNIIQFNPKKRLSFNQIIKHKYFEDVYSAEDVVRSDKEIDFRMSLSLKKAINEYRKKESEEKKSDASIK